MCHINKDKTVVKMEGLGRTEWKAYSLLFRGFEVGTFIGHVDKDCFCIDVFCVRPFFKRRGYGKSLMKAAETYALSVDDKVEYLRVEPKSYSCYTKCLMRAAKLYRVYEKYGFELVVSTADRTVAGHKMEKRIRKCVE